MKFLVDAQLPVKLAQLLRQKGYNTIHTKELPE
jgi:predicted nuclease of predicted toxin-antitoxin system